MSTANVSIAPATITPKLHAATIPPLEPGDHLSRDEFERRFDATPNLKKAELLEGVAHMPPPVGYESHGRQNFNLAGLLTQYAVKTPGVRGAQNCSVRLDLDNMPQPDALLMIRPECGGQVVISSDGYIEGAPELVVEVSSSTVSIDLNTKFRVCRRNRVREYLVWRVRDRAFDWFALRGSDYERLQPDERGLVKSSIFPGLWLDTAAMLCDDLVGVLRVLDEGLQSAEHAAFVAELSGRSPRA